MHFSQKQYYPLLLLLIFIISCKGQSKVSDCTTNYQLELKAISIWPQEIKILESDLYFIETKDINTSFGPRNIPRNIAQDKIGNIWLACWEGLFRYDSSDTLWTGRNPLPTILKGFTNFTNKESLRRYRTFFVLQDKSGII